MLLPPRLGDSSDLPLLSSQHHQLWDPTWLQLCPLDLSALTECLPGDCLSVVIHDGEVIPLYLLEHPLEPGWCSWGGLLGNHQLSLERGVHTSMCGSDWCWIQQQAFPGQCLGSCFVLSWAIWMQMQRADCPAKLLRQGLSLNCLPPVWWVLLGQSIWCTTLLRPVLETVEVVFRHSRWGILLQEVPEWLWFFTEVGDECCEACHHTKESLQILFVLWSRHVLDIIDHSQVWPDSIFGVYVAEEADRRLRVVIPVCWERGCTGGWGDVAQPQTKTGQGVPSHVDYCQ